MGNISHIVLDGTIRHQTVGNINHIVLDGTGRHQNVRNDSQIVLILMAETDPRPTESQLRCTCHDGADRPQTDRNVSHIVFVFMAQTDPRLTEMPAILYLSSWHIQTPQSQKCQPYCICLHGTGRPQSHRNVSHTVFVFMAQTDPRVTEMSAILYLSSWHRQTPD